MEYILCSTSCSVSELCNALNQLIEQGVNIDLSCCKIVEEEQNIVLITPDADF